jgi:predicted adenylyl cyclase CyaB
MKRLKKIIELGGSLKYDSMTESYPFLKEGFSSYDSSMQYLRVKKVNDEITITYKDPSKESDTVTNREEIEIKIDNYEEAIKLIEKLGFEKGELFKKHRMHYELKNIHFEFDTLENLPTYLEIETQSEKDMISICNKLNLDINQGKKGTIVEILPELFNK